MFDTTKASLFRSTFAMAIAIAATTAIVAGSAAPAHAQDAVNAGNTATYVIDVRGIDLASPAGEARIVTLVERAARRVCSTNADRGAAANQARRACIETTLSQYLPRVAQLAENARSARSDLADVTAPTTPVGR